MKKNWSKAITIEQSNKNKSEIAKVNKISNFNSPKYTRRAPNVIEAASKKGHVELSTLALIDRKN